MKNTTSENSPPKGGSIAVYQRLMQGKRPAKVEVLRAVYETYRVPDGKVFGRTNNAVLLRIPSGTAVLSESECAALQGFGLDAKQIDYVNTRLASLAGPAQARTHEMDILDAKEKVKSVASLSESAPCLAKDLRAILAGALHEIEERIEAGGGPVDLGGKAPTELLKDTLVLLNHACLRAQALYRQLPKGELPDDLILEFQRSWFLHPDMVSTFRNRKCFSRPAGWTGLRAQVLAGYVYKHGDPIGDGKLSQSSDAV